MLRLLDTLHESVEFGEDRIGGRGPCNQGGLSAVVLDEAVDFGHQFLDTAKRAAADRFFCLIRKRVSESRDPLV